MGPSGCSSLLPEPQEQLGLPLPRPRCRGNGPAGSRRARAGRDGKSARRRTPQPDPNRRDSQLQRRSRRHARAGAAAGRAWIGVPPRFSIAYLHPGEAEAIRQAAELLVEGFREDWPDAWPTTEAALQEVRESLLEERISLVALDENGAVLGWIGGLPSYSGNVWELHPLVVRPDVRRRGVGRALVADLEARVRERGGLTLWLGTDDESGMTSLSGVDLYPDVLEHLANIENLHGHPYEFYQQLGFSIVGVLPDANGVGKPDIYMAKRCRYSQSRND